MNIDIRPQPLTREAFAPFGDVIACDGVPVRINNGTTERFHDLANIKVDSGGGRALLNIFRGQPFVPPLRILMMERHPLGSQAFMPLSSEPFLMVVADTDEPPEPQDLWAFISSPISRLGQGINYAPGIWHHPLISLNRVSDFLVVDRGSPEGAPENDNLDEYFFPEDAKIWLHNI